jgi:hypothetical protein
VIALLLELSRRPKARIRDFECAWGECHENTSCKKLVGKRDKNPPDTRNRRVSLGSWYIPIFPPKEKEFSNVVGGFLRVC